MTRLAIFALLLTISLTSVGQLSKSEQAYLREGIIAKVNTLRAELDVGLLSENKDLQCAAELQSRYMAKHGKLTHLQDKERSRTVMQRVDACSKGGFIQVGENISYFEPSPVKRTPEVLDSMVDRVFRLWVDSKDHYWNMVNSAFTHCDYGFAFDKTNGDIYCTQVLGRY